MTRTQHLRLTNRIAKSRPVTTPIPFPTSTPDFATFRLVGRTQVFRALYVYEVVGERAVEGVTLDGRYRTAARLADIEKIAASA